MSLTPGARFGPYQIQSALGAGGMGEVYRARDTKLNRDVALKVLPDDFAADPDRLARFKREAQLLAALNHPNIAAIYGLEDSERVPALVLELVDGPTLADRIAQGPVPLDEALLLAQQMAAALETAHEHGIVHRDLKPANIKVRDDGTVKVLDFGLAKALEGDVAAVAVSQSPTLSVAATRMGVILGTAAYMAPEQARGKAADKRADIWAFGCVLFETLSGEPPFAGDSVSEILAEVMKSEPRWEALPADLPARVTSVLRRCLEKDPMRRVRDIGDVRLALEGAFDSPSTQRGVATGAAASPTHSAPWRIATHGAALLAGALVAAGALWTLPRPAPQPVARFQLPLPAATAFSFPGRPLVALSPDGQLVVYVANGRLQLRRIDQLDALPLRGTEEGGGRSPFFSPDGQWIGFWSAGQLKRISIAGGAPIVIGDAENPWGVSWEPDGTILYGQGPAGIWTISAAGGTPQQLIRVDEGEQAHGPQLLPGGEWVLFTFRPRAVTNWDEAQIVAQSLRTGERKVIVAGGRDARYLPTGHLVYAQNGSLLAVPLDAGALQTRGGAISLVEGVGDAGTTTGAVHFSMASNGSLVYVPTTFSSATRQLVLVARDGREELLAAEPRAYVNPRISSDGLRVAVSVAPDFDIWVWHRTRATLTRLTFDPAPEVDPVWSPDGSSVIFTSGGRGLFRQQADGASAAERLLETASELEPLAFTPDGRLLVHEPARPGQPRDVRLITFGSPPTARTLLGTAFDEERPALSPDGRWLAYQSNESGQAEVYVRPFPDVERGRWQVSRGGGEEPSWSPNGAALYYLTTDGMMAVPVAPGATFSPGSPTRLFSVLEYSFPNAARRYDIAPDGRFLIMKGAVLDNSDGAGEPPHLVLVQHWLDELRERVPAN